MREGVVFYRSFADAIKSLPEELQLEALWGVIEYGLDGKIPDGNGVATAIYLMAKPQIDANNKRYENGTKGGRPITKAEPKDNQTITKAEPKDNQTITKAEPKDNQTITKAEPKEKEKVKDKVKVKDNKKLSAPDDESPCAGRFLLNDGTEYAVSENDVVTYQQLYPGIDVSQELRNIQAWCLSNPKNRKTKAGAKRFLNGWLSRAQNSARPAQKDISQESAPRSKFNNFPQRKYDYDELERQLLNTQPLCGHDVYDW